MKLNSVLFLFSVVYLDTKLKYYDSLEYLSGRVRFRISWQSALAIFLKKCEEGEK